MNILKAFAENHFNKVHNQNLSLKGYKACILGFLGNPDQQLFVMMYYKISCLDVLQDVLQDFVVMYYKIQRSFGKGFNKKLKTGSSNNITRTWHKTVGILDNSTKQQIYDLYQNKTIARQHNKFDSKCEFFFFKGQKWYFSLINHVFSKLLCMA